MRTPTGPAAVFLDRDGTIIEDVEYIKDPALVKFLPDALEGLRLMRSKGYLLFVISNQSGVGRRLIKLDEFNAVHSKMNNLLKEAGIKIDNYLYCFHRPEENCACRKPKPGLIPKLWQGQVIPWNRSFVVGDKDSDVELATAIGAVGYLILTGKGPNELTQMTNAGHSPRTVTSLKALAEILPPST